MINYRSFLFAAAPRTGTTWVLHAAEAVGLGEGSKAHVHIPFDDPLETPTEGFRVSLVRHPCSWLLSYYCSVYPGFIGVPAVDRFRYFDAPTFEIFIQHYLREFPGEVGRMFESYRAQSYLRTEDFPWGFLELLRAVEVPQHERDACVKIPKQNEHNRKHVRPRFPRSLWNKVMEAERPMAKRFGYFD